MRTGCRQERQASGDTTGFRAILLLSTAALLSACAVPTHYAGIDLRPGAAFSEIQTLAQRARSGDKQAQLELGIAYEEGKGLAPDPKRARKLYRAAATDSGGTIFVYVPATRKGGKGSVMPFDRGPRVAGLAEARERLKRRAFEPLSPVKGVR